MWFAIALVLACALAALLLAWIYFRRYKIKRAPIGVLNLADLVAMMAAIILVPLLYLWLPRWAVAALLALETCSLLYLFCEPAFKRRSLIWAVALGLVGANLLAYNLAGSGSPAFFAVNDLSLILVAAGIANVQAQSGLKSRDAALLGAFLVGYDFVATSALPLMADLVSHVAALPFSPVIAWPVAAAATWTGSAGDWAGLGLGDVVIGALFPLTMRKAFGRTAGLLALVCSFVAYVSAFLLPTRGLFPVMVVLGPLMVAQYTCWRFLAGAERTMRRYLLHEPI